MKNEGEIAARIEELRGKLKKEERHRKSYANATEANRTTLGIRVRRELEGMIAGLEWVLGKDKQGTQI